MQLAVVCPRDNNTEPIERAAWMIAPVFRKSIEIGRASAWIGIIQIAVVIVEDRRRSHGDRRRPEYITQLKDISAQAVRVICRISPDVSDNGIARRRISGGVSEITGIYGICERRHRTGD